MIYRGYVHSNRVTSYIASTLCIATFDVKRTHIHANIRIYVSDDDDDGN